MAKGIETIDELQEADYGKNRWEKENEGERIQMKKITAEVGAAGKEMIAKALERRMKG